MMPNEQVPALKEEERAAALKIVRLRNYRMEIELEAVCFAAATTACLSQKVGIL